MRGVWGRFSAITRAICAARWPSVLAEFVALSVVLYATRLVSLNIWLVPQGDVREYYQYAQAFWLQRPLFHTLPVEYPPLSILPFSLTLLPPAPDTSLVFALWMLVVVLAGYTGFLLFSTRRRAVIYIVYLVLGAAATILARYDIVPALITLAALWAAERRRFTLSYALLAAGILLKLYPAFVVPVVALEHWRALRLDTPDRIAPSPSQPLRTRWREYLRLDASRWVARGLAFCAGLVVAGFVGAAILDSTGAFSLFGYAGERPIQIESLPATILWLGTIIGIPARVNYSFTSLNYVGTLDPLLRPLSALALAGGCLWVYWRQARGRLDVARAFLAAMAVVLVTNKIFSPQYVIWILPVVAYVEGFDLLWLAIAVLTTYDFPIIYQSQHPIEHVPFSWQFMPVVALRNGLLLWVTVRAIVRSTQREDQTLWTIATADGEIQAADGIRRTHPGSEMPGLDATGRVGHATSPRS